MNCKKVCLQINTMTVQHCDFTINVLKGPCHTSQFWVNYSSAHKQKNTLISKYFFNHGLTIHLPLMNFCENSDGNVVFLVGIAWKWLPINCIMGHGPFALIAVQSPNRWGSSGVWLLAWSICLWNLFTIRINCSKMRWSTFVEVLHFVNRPLLIYSPFIVTVDVRFYRLVLAEEYLKLHIYAILLATLSTTINS